MVDQKAADSGSRISFRRSNLWFKPVDQVKVVAGYVGNDQNFKERINDWKVGSPFNLNERDWIKHPGYVNCADVDEMGIGLEVEPVPGLVVTGGIAPSITKSFLVLDHGESENTAWGLSARYWWNDYGFQISYRDNGLESWKVARAGFGISNLKKEGLAIYGNAVRVSKVEIVSAQ